MDCQRRSVREQSTPLSAISRWNGPQRVGRIRTIQKHFSLTTSGATPYCFFMSLGSFCAPHRCTMERRDAESIWSCVVAGLRVGDHGHPGARAGDGCCASGQEHRRLLDPSFCSQDGPGRDIDARESKPTADFVTVYNFYGLVEAIEF